LQKLEIEFQGRLKMAKHQYFSFVTVSQQQKAKSPEPRQNFKFVKIKEQKDLRLFKF